MTARVILEINDLSMVYATKSAELAVLREINLEIQVGQIYGLVGESGSGKTSLGLAIMRYLPVEGRVTQGRIRLASNDLLSMSLRDLRNLWGTEISFVPQDPSSSLNPSIRVGDQLAECLRSARSKGNSIQRQVFDWLARVGLPDPEQLADKFPHELSGGQKQRILMAMALSNQPRLLILDEPTTSLDVTTEVVVLDLLKELIAEQGTSVLMITHNLGVVAGLTERVAVLYAGELVEDALTNQLYQQPLHPYTQGLLNSVPKIGVSSSHTLLTGIPGQIPSMDALPDGCIFSPRCPLAVELCHLERPNFEPVGEDRRVRCHRWREIESGKISTATVREVGATAGEKKTGQLLEVADIDVIYPVRGSGISSLFGKKKTLKAVNQVSIQLGEGRTLGIVGESGSGKSSFALAIMGLADTPVGEINLFNIKLPPKVENRDRETLRQLQMVFQHHDEAFSPQLKIEQILSRPLINLLGLSRQAARKRVIELLELVRLPAEFIQRYPRQLSGGEKQRVAIAQAFAANPRLLITDEPVSALDVSVQANILNLLKGLNREQHTAIILISHDIGAVSYLADQVAVMYLGQLMQLSPASTLLSLPLHPYTEALLSAVPVADPGHQAKVIRLAGEVPTPQQRPSGCPFHTRCPRSLGKICEQQTPPWQDIPEGGKIFCHIPIEDLLKNRVGVVPPALEREGR